MSLSLLPHSTHFLNLSLKRPRNFSASIPKLDLPISFHLFPSSSSLLPTSTTISPLSLNREDATARHVVQAVKEEQAPYTSSDAKSVAPNPSNSSSKLVLVIGGSGGVGQLIVASLLSRGIKSRLLLRDPAKAVSLFGKQDESTMEVWKGDMRNPNDLDPAMFEGPCFIGSYTYHMLHWNYRFSFKALGWR